MPSPLPHRYTVHLDARTVRSEGRPPLEIAPPPEWDGPPGVWSPEHLLLAAVAACFTTTFEAVARRSGLTWSNWQCGVEGILERTETGTWFTTVALKPALRVAAADELKASRLLASAKRNCFVSSSLKAEVALEPAVTTVEEEEAPR